VGAADRAIPQYVDGVLERPAPEIPAPIRIRMNRPDEIFPRNVSCFRMEIILFVYLMVSRLIRRRSNYFSRRPYIFHGKEPLMEITVIVLICGGLIAAVLLLPWLLGIRYIPNNRVGIVE
jgi:hypothetical protein